MKVKFPFFVAISATLLVGCGSDAKSTAPEPVSSSESSSSLESSSSVSSSSEDSSSSLESSSSLWVDRHLAWDYLNPDIEYKEFTDARDGHVYKYFEYGNNLRIMAENLNYSDSVANSFLRGNSWCIGNSLDSCSKYGRYYTWAIAMNLNPYIYNEEVSMKPEDSFNLNYQGLCPEGWFLFADENILDYTLRNVRGEDYCALRGWNASVCADKIGFSALPGGIYEDGEFKHVGEAFYLWTVLNQKMADTGVMWILRFSETEDGVRTHFGRYSMKKSSGAPIRCYQKIEKKSLDVID
ncbi:MULTISPECIES: FISUMP domain-containing protein [unclassified Fibrobacter]|uniref:FISUMP domain-containing protein n=1 Tax=unclassified Fibrobacter TaxID=2634177 RepID=UPI000D79BCEB|nr:MULTISPECIES: FISUMP domain-containing protein [unclassified Fibrobacter]PWJ68276.1 uncharacterized protein (TIGR02145 family) [Fibrobacter sp. UWR4]PZW65610.1 uncharacterized protein (TIGR02145 family) [Fibrobacter sp. UWR1]